ncbi:GNAT family N-acetyltransferase [Haloterrigena sp. SYSU A121-1]|uniref:GNAT family N-acetyltransferase n=1 Tax=Haloterrigena gelatinilytica TaxID=2741724 RepID=A0A8J8GHV7_9EURY|nr:GNAT family N-acetyltransferase [Haloterrigena gelatinilytica]NUB89946.1 GNAT family N-acetyltransferase [Haloterrigena gelatinilytica]
MRIRPAADDDFPDIRAIARKTWHDTYDELDEDLIDRTVESWYTDDSMPLEAPGTVVLVVEATDGGRSDSDGDIVGFTHAVVQGDTADILRMYVDPVRQAAGVGTDLHERLVEQLRVYDVERIRAFDFAFNDASRQFYEGFGFERTDVDEVEIDGECYDEAVYTLELSQ